MQLNSSPLNSAFSPDHPYVLQLFNKLDTKRKLEIINPIVGMTHSGSKQ